MIADLPLLSPDEIKQLSDEEVKEYFQLVKYVDPVVFAQEFFGIEVWDKQAEMLRAAFSHPRVAVRSGQKTGKALSLDTPIPTPDGWKTMGTLQVGDYVFDENSKLTRILTTSEIFTDHDCYELEFDNGEKVIADAGHRWKVNGEVKTTAELAQVSTARSVDHSPRLITAITPTAPVPVKCISVDSPSHLFLCTESFIPTHNTAAAAILALMWFHVKEQGRVIVTSSSYNQVKNVLWAEIRRMVHRAEARGHPPFARKISLEPESGIHDDKGEKWIIGLSTNEPEKMAGYSGHELLIICDEASGVDNALFDAMLGNLAGGGHLFLISNPTKTSGFFYDIFKYSRETYKLIHVSAEDTPNARAKKRIIPGLADWDYIANARKELRGKESPFYQVRILGEFPKQDSQAVVPLYLIEAAHMNWEPPKNYDEPLVLGVDPSRFGSDAGVVQPVRGKVAYPYRELLLMDGPTGAGEIIRFARELRRNDETVTVNIDNISIGASPYDFLVANAPSWLVVNGISAAEVPSRPDEFMRLRDELWWGIREWLEDGGTFPHDNDLEQELAVVQYDFDVKSRVKVMDKKEIKKKLKGGRSTDHADALALAVYKGSGDLHYDFW